MTTLAQADMFFFISSIGFIIIGILLVILIALGIRIAFSLLRTLEKVESSVDKIGDVTLDLLDDVRGNPFFRMLFHSKKKHRTHIHKGQLEK